MGSGPGEQRSRSIEDWFVRSQRAKPFLRWAGGKTRFLQAHADLFPRFSGNYLEPFLGAGAVFFHFARTQQRPFVARLGDVNLHLIRAYVEVRADPDAIYERLVSLQAGYSAATDKAAFYYEIRDSHNARHPRPDTAAFIFLNRTCWNGLWRVNQEGKFNVPYGAPKTETVIPSLDDLRNVSSALSLARLRCTSWENTLALAEPHDFVFLDPPYYSDLIIPDRGHQPKYSADGFTLRSHHKLAEAMRSLERRGVQFVLTNSAEPEMRELYERYGFNARVVSIPRAINSKIDERQGVPELVVTPGEGERPSVPAAVLLDLEVRRRSRLQREATSIEDGKGQMDDVE